MDHRQIVLAGQIIEVIRQLQLGQPRLPGQQAGQILGFLVIRCL